MCIHMSMNAEIEWVPKKLRVVDQPFQGRSQESTLESLFQQVCSLDWEYFSKQKS